MLKKTIFSFTLTLFILAKASTGNAEEVPLETRFDSLIASVNPNLNAGIYVESLKTHESLYKKNYHRHFIPASALKIVTTLAALAELGPNYTYATHLYLKESKKTKNNYNLFLEFSGDPTLTEEDLVKLFAEIKTLHPDITIRNLVIDTYGMGRIPPLNPGALLEDIEMCETTPISVAIINKNFYDYALVPSKRMGKPATLKSKSGLTPPYPIENNTKTVAPGRISWQSYGFVGGTMRIEGEIAENRNIALPTRSLKKFIKAHLEQALDKAGITLKGSILWKPVPNHLEPVASHKSVPLERMLIDASHRSDNIIYDTLFLKVGTLPDAVPVTTWKEAGKRIKRTIHKHYGVDLTHSVIVDGSGLSRYNLITPAQLSTLLVTAYQKTELGKIFFKTLPANGIDGTLSRRMTEPEMKEKVHAKTGFMTGISTLVGNLTTDSGDTLIIVFMMNDFVGPITPYQNLQDDLCRILAKQ